jgi:signal recognition particle GTPase
MAWSFAKVFQNLFTGSRLVDSSDWENLEDTLLQADFGPRVTDEVIDGAIALLLAPAKP